MKRLAIFIALIATNALTQVSSPDLAHPYVADVILGGSSIRSGGHWRSADLIVTKTIPRTVGYLFVHRSERPEGSGGFLGVAATHDWAPRFFTYAAAGGSVPRASYLPTSRFDVDLNFKLLGSQRLLATAGATTARYAEQRRDDVIAAGVTYYAPVIVTYRFFHNTSTPGEVGSHAQMVQLAIERRRDLSAYLRHSWGHEAYQLTTIVAPENVRLSGHTTTAFVRKWTSARGGFVTDVEWQTKAADFRRLGVRAGLFYSF
jgi:YaiO family outer membrane protein